MKKAYIFVGPPGSGKGTQAEILAEKKRLTLIQPGVFLRNEIDRGTALGLKIKPLVNRGVIVPGDVVDNIIYKVVRGAKNDCIFDGYPRHFRQSERLFNFLNEKKTKVYFIEIYLADDKILERINGRRSCSCGETYHVKYNPSKKKGICDKCGKRLFIRTDSKSSVVKRRIKVYYEQTAPVVQYFKQHNNKLIKFVFVNGDQSIETVTKEIMKGIK
jgi:adenylate kinase